MPATVMKLAAARMAAILCLQQPVHCRWLLRRRAAADGVASMRATDLWRRGRRLSACRCQEKLGREKLYLDTVAKPLPSHHVTDRSRCRPRSLERSWSSQPPALDLSAAVMDGWPLGVGAQFVVSGGALVLCLNWIKGFLDPNGRSSFHVQFDHNGMRTPQCTCSSGQYHSRPPSMFPCPVPTSSYLCSTCIYNEAVRDLGALP